MTRALETLKRVRPELYTEFIRLLSEDLGLPSILQNSFKCPNCDAALSVSNNVHAKHQALVKNEIRKRGWKTNQNSLFNLLVRVARLKKKTTGGVSAEFNKAMATKIRHHKPDEVRQVKIKWLSDQLQKKTAT